GARASLPAHLGSGRRGAVLAAGHSAASRDHRSVRAGESRGGRPRPGLPLDLPADWRGAPAFSAAVLRVAAGRECCAVSQSGAVALAFQPVRNRVQRLANRLVYGNRATPYEVLSSFSRLAESFASEDVLSRTAQILSEGTGATAIVWLKTGDTLRASARWPEGADLPAES